MSGSFENQQSIKQKERCYKIYHSQSYNKGQQSRMRLAIRFKQQGEKVEHLAEKNMNRGLQGASLENHDEDANQFELEYLVSHNTKIIKTGYRPVTNRTDELIDFVSKIVGISQHFLIFRITNRFYRADQDKQLQKQQKPLNSNQKIQQPINNSQLLKDKNAYGGVDFTDHSIKKVKLTKGFSLERYNICDVEIQKSQTNQNLSETKKSGSEGDAARLKILQIEVEIVSAYYSSQQYKEVLAQNETSKVNQMKARMTINLKNKAEDETFKEGIIEEEEEEDEDDEKEQQEKRANRNNEFLKLEAYKMDENQGNNQIYDTSISSYKGELTRVRKPPLKDHKMYYQIDPYKGFFRQFETREKYPKFPSEEISLDLIKQKSDIQKIQGKALSWYMKKQLSYFSVEFTNSKQKKNKFKFCCNFSQTADKWISAFNNVMEKWHQIRQNPIATQHLVRNQKSILDRVELSMQKKTANPSKYIEAFQNTFGKQPECHQEETQIKSPDFALQNSKSEEEQKPNKGDTQPIKKVESEILKKSETKTSNTTTASTPEVLEQQLKGKPKSKAEQDEEQGLKLRHFKLLKELGEGSFGQVFLATHTGTQKQYALKVFKKKKLVVMKQIKFAIAQINILKQINHPFVISLHFTFQTPNYIYLGLDFCGGKDLSHHLIEEVNFSETDCRLYAAELVLALEYLHSLGIIYRDLKPENVLLDSEGHLKIIDFGLSKQTDNNFAKSFCGSPAYISPEMLKKNGVGKQCDYFSLGAVIYEMLVGEPPFYSDDIKELYENIANAKLKFPKIVSEKARSLLEGLLRKNPKTRLGSKGFHEIKNHEFFKGIEWDRVFRREYDPPKRLIIEGMEEREDENQTELIKILHEDFDYNETNMRINRFKNFSFVREGEFE